MKIIAMETVTRIGGIALVIDQQVTAVKIIDTQLRHAANIINSLDNLLQETATPIADIDAFAVDIGPGSFTGIRVGIACVLGLAQPGNKKLIGLSSLEILKFLAVNSEMVGQASYLIPLIDAKRGEIFVSWYRKKSDSFELVKHPYLTTPEQLRTEIPEGSFLFGPEITKFAPAFHSGNRISTASNDIYPDAASLGLMAASRLAGDYQKKSLEPLYIYDKIITRK